jgi:hypothetical protein
MLQLSFLYFFYWFIFDCIAALASARTQNNGRGEAHSGYYSPFNRLLGQGDLIGLTIVICISFN